jgi:hypothetical protein
VADPRIEAARRKAYILYEGVETPHRSCGIALAETFGLPTRPYQAFRRGGITGEGPCGAIEAGLVILGELLGDPDPAGAVTPALRDAAVEYRRRVRESVFGGAGDADTVCNHLTAPFGDFRGEARRSFCTGLVSTVAGIVAEVAIRHGAGVTVAPPTDNV